MSAEADLLRRAAKSVREAGQAAQARGPYFVEGRCVCDDYEDFEDRCSHRKSSWRLRTQVPHDPTIISYEVANFGGGEVDARWSALASPVIAGPLAAWLDDAVAAAEVVDGPCDPAEWPALRLAAALLGETAPEDAP